ncbi:CitMHS family transporter [Streptomyces sp. NPDC059255]|uniref:CitMHS family transporter n=1 Tax=Streptomyces sp. NPDC059255 TaxID=3346793 RepID=UPI0036BAD4A4
MLASFGYAVVVLFIVLIMTKRLSAIVALILIPLAAGLLVGKGDVLGDAVLDGIRSLAPTAALLTFAILFFSVMIDVGLFDPLVRLALKVSGADPVKIAVATAVLTLLVSLDGDGSSTYLIVCAAFLPLYDRLGMSRLVLATIALLAVACTNLTPWGGPVSRASSALKVEPAEIFLPMIPVMIAGALATVIVAGVLGLRERRRLTWAGVSFAEVMAGDGVTPSSGSVGASGSAGAGDSAEPVEPEGADGAADPLAAWHRRVYWVNAALTLGLMACLVLEVWPLALLFATGFALAMLVNFPQVAEQGRRINSYSSSVIPIISLILAAGVFVGVLEGTGMVDAMGAALVGVIPDGLGTFYGPLVAVTALPLTFALSNEAYYFGVLPLLAEGGAAHGLSAAEVARAALTGAPVHALSPLVASLYLLSGRLQLNLGDLQRKALPWALAVSVVMIAATLLTGAVPVGR